MQQSHQLIVINKFSIVTALNITWRYLSIYQDLAICARSQEGIFMKGNAVKMESVVG